MGSEKIAGVLGDFVTLVSRKNKNLEVTKLVGVSADRAVIPSPLQGRNTNLKICQIIEVGDFVVRLMDIEKTKKLAIFLYEGKERVAVSSQYHVFRVTSSLLNNHYLMLIFKKTVTDLKLLYRCFGGIRGELAWKDFVKFSFLFPDIKVQERIVDRYQTVTKYIEVKKRINELLERKMKAYFHILFDDLKDCEIKSFGELFTIIRGGRPPRSNRWLEELYFCKEGGIPWLKVGDISQEYKFVNSSEEQLTEEGFKKGRCTLIGGGTSFSYITHTNNKLKTSPLIQQNCVSPEKSWDLSQKKMLDFLFFFILWNKMLKFYWENVQPLQKLKPLEEVHYLNILFSFLRKPL
ncbi:hypothetical protein WEN_01380 [Mycoplasma wenyonii str. Massachusetts]|uniref:Type I restriction modification DNA specificity domain-containing protein n=1 Tax=Mycoplasma wenyonii (strain Massachusetts) TaxID=1197325 RepID=I6Z669_MYCWM|nr:restriction endonuclease subunit S [Mycoplasma wenyonii]AFN65073.1 hypothetical protein WEN_01380 [Mycoplasma wenyonii str. Massachusetts]